MEYKYLKSRPSIPAFVEHLYWGPTLSQGLTLVLRRIAKNKDLAAPGESKAWVCNSLLWTLDTRSCHQVNCTYIEPGPVVARTMTGKGHSSGPVAYGSPSPPHTACNVQDLVFCVLAACVYLFSRKLKSPVQFMCTNAGQEKCLS